MPFRASEILARILYDKNVLTFTGDPITLHSIFYELYISNPEVMDCFDFIKRANPYSPPLDRMIQLFQLTGALSRKNPDFTAYSVERNILEKILTDETAHLHIKGLDRIDEIIQTKI